MPQAAPRRPRAPRSALLHPLALLAVASLMSGNAALPRDGTAATARYYRTARRAPSSATGYYDQEREGRAAPPAALPPATSPGWPFQPIQVNVDISRGSASVPLVVVPVPVPVPGPSAGCGAPTYHSNSGGGVQYEQFYPISPAQRPPARPPGGLDEERRPPARPLGGLDEDRRPPARPEPEPERRPPSAARLPPPLPDARFPPVSYASEEDDSEPPPHFPPVHSSEQLVKEFRAQTPRAPELPPMLLSGFDASERAPLPDGSAALATVELELAAPAPVPAAPVSPAPTPVGYATRSRGPQRNQETEPGAKSPPPKYNLENLALMRAQLTVRRADYTEPYTVWFDASSGNARVDFHDGSTSSFRSVAADGRVRRSLVWVQRSGGGEVRRCATAVGASPPAGVQHPALPDLSEFTYAGKEETASGPVEVWRRTVTGRAGELGAARGEALTTRHEMRFARVDRTAVPLRYTVTVDSSTLGSDCDSYEHVYQYDAAAAPPMPQRFFDVELDKLCDSVETLNASSAEHVARLEPLREFTLPHRDPRHDQLFDRYRSQYVRQYADETEEAVRKNVVMQSTRFAAAGNRQGGTSELGATLLADRLSVEVRRMMGARGDQAALAAAAERDSFPYTREDVRAQERRLPSGFDWRARGAVSPVGFQGLQCSSCWAFAVSGAVEGALYRRARRLVPLSYQCLVDCAHPFGGNGCKGTWPSHAYSYVQERGLPALDEYPAYKEKVDKCVEQSVPSQTRISGHVNVTTNSVPALKVAIRRHAPSVVIVDADCQSFILHKKGVLYDDRCGKALRQLHHAVLAVGWGERRGEPHFILKNSWSAKWGEKGYIRVQARANTCGVLTMPSYPELEEGDVRQPLRASARPQRHRPPPSDYEDAIDSDYY